MVLRGSKTKPDHSLFEVQEEIRKAREYLQKSEQEMVQNIDSLTSDLVESISHAERVNGSYVKVPIEGVQSIHRVIDRLEELESIHSKAQRRLKAKETEFYETTMQFMCGGMAGVTARTVVSPLDRVKLLVQTAHARGTDQRGIFRTFNEVMKNEGFKSFWKGNLTNCIRVFPYASIQFGSYDRFKKLVMKWAENNNRDFGFRERLISGACAGTTAAVLTYPLDVMRLRQVVDKDVTGPISAVRNIYAEGGLRMFAKGLSPTIMSLGPFIAVNFATFDWLKANFAPPKADGTKHSPFLTLGLGAGAGLIAQSIGYPLDTVRRRMQLKGTLYNGTLDCFRKIYIHEGFGGFYNGVMANAVKIVPNNGVRFLAYSYFTTWAGVSRKKGGGD